ncbi:helix-turn-helix domain-containing protein [Paraburkholderia tropica]|uniref:helix-turn-helix domain-containing protein n=1 Tax=Paraburkholderia tropica TaxID=92647 RepID=UPI002ABD79BB|nr:AraC family transcriptional regulator [Paraburkholderia tropica]
MSIAVPSPTLKYGATLEEAVLGNADATAIRLSYQESDFGFMPVPERDDAYFVGVKLRPMKSVRMWYGERLASAEPMPANSLIFTHFDDQPHAELEDPFDCMIFKVPRISLQRSLDELSIPSIDSVRCPDPGTLDPTIGHLAQCLVPALAAPDAVSPLFVDSVMRALHVHVLDKYGGIKLTTPTTSGRKLSEWQKAKVIELLNVHLDGDVNVAALASECGLSTSHFAHAFRQTFGDSPYQYLIGQRLQRAKDLMIGSKLPLAEIALRCGFANQSHFNQRFVKAFGVPPGVWRRARR